MGTKLWLVGQSKKELAEKDWKYNWDFQGVFDNESKAVSACKNENYFVAPVELNVVLPDETLEWSGLYYPVKIDKGANHED